MNDKKISPNRLRKENIVAELKDKIARAKGMVFTSYQGLTHKQLEGLKKKVQALSADFVATKNTLIKLALLNSKLETRNSKQRDSGVADASQNDVILASRRRVQNPSRISDFQGSTATLFLYGDPVSPLKELAKTIKELNLPTIKFGILDGEVLTQDQVIKISTLPSRDILLAQLAFSLKSPISGLHRALNWNLQKFVMTLHAIESKKSQAQNSKS